MAQYEGRACRFDFFVTKKLKLQTDCRDYCLATTQDGLYSASGTRTVLNRNARSRHIGSEVDLLGVFQINKTTSIAAEVGHLFAGAYLAQSTKGSGYTYPSITMDEETLNALLVSHRFPPHIVTITFCEICGLEALLDYKQAIAMALKAGPIRHPADGTARNGMGGKIDIMKRLKGIATCDIDEALVTPEICRLKAAR